MKSSLTSLIAPALALILMILPGCSKSPAELAADSDANGYVCMKCGDKFYTARKIFAEKCPKCGTIELKEVIGFICEKDQHVTLVPRGNDGTLCDQCKQIVKAMKLPREKELQTWGARKETAEHVLLK